MALGAWSLELGAFFFFLFGPGAEAPKAGDLFCDLFMWKSVFVPLAARNFRFILVPSAVNQSSSHMIASFFESVLDHELGRLVGLILLTPLKIHLCFHNPILSQIPVSVNIIK